MRLSDYIMYCGDPNTGLAGFPMVKECPVVDCSVFKPWLEFLIKNCTKWSGKLDKMSAFQMAFKYWTRTE